MMYLNRNVQCDIYRKQRCYTVCKENDSLCFGIGILAGVTAGIVAGILLAPKKGEDSRKEIKDVIENLAETQAPRVKCAKKQALEAIDLFKYKMEKQFKRLANSLKSNRLEKAKRLEESNDEYEIN